MSDGEASFPNNAINLFTNDRTFKDMIEFYSIGFGSGADSSLMRRIANQMPNGKMTIALDAAALNETFSKIVFNVLGDQN